jgi:hypothetical protein
MEEEEEERRRLGQKAEKSFLERKGRIKQWSIV